MRILFTGSSSFTGYWFVNELAAAGHDVVATLQSSPDSYEGLRGRRVRELAEHCRFVPDCSFGNDGFLELLGEGSWDVLCHHGADSTNYKSADFDVFAALQNNGHRIREVLHAFQRAGGHSVVLTGSYFENDEGVGSGGAPAFSPYGLSKGLTSQLFRYFASAQGLNLGKFVIPNPFGPLEEPRFTAYLIRSWRSGEVPSVNTPDYMRDNIHVSLLAKCYARFVDSQVKSSGFTRINPSGYVESQGAFARRFAREMEARLGMPCSVELAHQTEFQEPLIRINTDTCSPNDLGWNEGTAWDALADYYRSSESA